MALLEKDLSPIILKDEDVNGIVNIFKALADETRVRIISLLTERESICVSDIANELEMTVTSVSHQLSKLKDLGFVAKEKSGKNAYYHLDDDCIRSILRRAEEHVSGK